MMRWRKQVGALAAVLRFTLDIPGIKIGRTRAGTAVFTGRLVEIPLVQILQAALLQADVGVLSNLDRCH